MDLDKKYYIVGKEFIAPALESGLYVVSTPIGNLKDISIRSLEILSACDLIYCEDTRTSAKLLNHYGIKTKKAPLHDHNEKSKIDSLLKRLGENQAIAIISDAGTPLISDPGFFSTRAVQDAGFNIFAAPGASAILAALTISAIPADKFSFFGFLPTKTGAKTNALKELKNWPQTLIFYESPRRLAATIKLLSEIFGEKRKAFIALELTKKFERSMRGDLSELSDLLQDKQIKGEAVIIVAGAEEEILDENIWLLELENSLISTSLKTAVNEIANKYSLKRKQVYNEALKIKKNKS